MVRSNRNRKRLSSAGAAQSVAANKNPNCLLGVADSAGGGMDGKPSWGLSLIDLAYHGDWSWKIDLDRVGKVMAFLTQMERNTWRQIMDQKTGGDRRGALHKFIRVESLCSAAQQRLGELEIDFDKLFRFRLGNMHRLWGVLPMPSGIFYPIWYDPDHKVCPGKDR
jgi:hypothetical protein